MIVALKLYALMKLLYRWDSPLSNIPGHLGELMRSIDHKIDAAGCRVARVNLSEVTPLLTLDIKTQLCLGDTPEGYDCDRDNRDFLEALNFRMRIQPYMATVTETSAGLLWLDKIPWLRRFLFPNAHSSDGFGRLMRISLIETMRTSWMIAHTSSHR